MQFAARVTKKVAITISRIVWLSLIRDGHRATTRPYFDAFLRQEVGVPFYL